MRVLIAMGLTAVYALCFVMIKAGLADAPPLRFAGLRTEIAGLSLLALIAILRQPIVPTRQQWPTVLVLAVVAGSASYGAMFVSPDRAGAVVAAVLGNLQPVFVVGLAALVLGERMGWVDRIALGSGVAGAFIIASPTLSNEGLAGLSGPTLALASSLGFGVGSVLVKRMRPGDRLLAVTAWQLVLGGLPLLIVSAIFEREDHISWTVQFATILLFLALVGTAGASAVWYWLLQGDAVGRLALLLFLVPVFSMGLAVVIDDQGIGRTEFVGIGVIVAGLVPLFVNSWPGAKANGE